MKQARQQTHEQTNNPHIRHPRRPGWSGDECCQNITMGWETRPSGTHFQRGKIPFNRNDGKQHCGQTCKTHRHCPNIDCKTSNFERIKLLRAQDEKIREFQIQEETDEQLKEKIIEAVDEEHLGKLKNTMWGTVTKLQYPSSLTSRQRGAGSPHWRRERP